MPRQGNVVAQVEQPFVADADSHRLRHLPLRQGKMHRGMRGITARAVQGRHGVQYLAAQIIAAAARPRTAVADIRDLDRALGGKATDGRGPYTRHGLEALWVLRLGQLMRLGEIFME